MIRLILSILMLLVLTVFITMNVSYTTSINLFGYTFEKISTIAVILVSIATGVVYSFFYYLLTYLAKSRRNKIRFQDKKSKEKAKELKVKEKNIQKIIDEEVQKSLPVSEEPAAPDTGGSKRDSLLKRIKGKK